MPLSLLNHSALALFAQRTRIPTSARSIGFCAIWVCISSSSSSIPPVGPKINLKELLIARGVFCRNQISCHQQQLLRPKRRHSAKNQLYDGITVPVQT